MDDGPGRPRPHPRPARNLDHRDRDRRDDQHRRQKPGIDAEILPEAANRFFDPFLARHAGFGALALVWIYTWTRGLTAAHRRWMIRSFALTRTAVTLRLQLPASALFGLDFDIAYLWIAFTCWLPSWLAAEARIVSTRPAVDRSRPLAPRAG